jgi:hypothetical protein
MRVTCELAGIDYAFIVTDEQAKLNVNELVKRTSASEARRVLAGLTGASASREARGPRIRLATRLGTTDDVAKRKASRQDEMPPIGGYDQLFAGAGPSMIVGSSAEAALARRVTCWGSGAVNVRRAETAVIREKLADQPPDVVEALIQARNRLSFRPLPRLLEQLQDVTDEQKRVIKNRLTDQSRCHGLWMIATGQQRSWYWLSVGFTAGNDDGKSRGDARQLWRRLDFAW